jgi:inosine-uridine nucleoside N-ribohydrolase/chitodextrinase
MVTTQVIAALVLITVAKPSAPISDSTRNLLLDAKVSGNLESFQKGLRGAPDHMIYDTEGKDFRENSQWHEYGVGFQQDLGVIAEDRPAWWMARWPKPVQANMIVLSGVYDNQPQPKTAWKIELRKGGKWLTHSRGVGGWYDRGRYVWGGPGTQPVEFDALRVSTFSKDNQTPIGSIHFRGEQGVSWVVANCPPIDAGLNPLPWPIRAGRPVELEATVLLGDISTWKWDLGDGNTKSGRKVNHTFQKPGDYKVRLDFSDGKHAGRLTRNVKVLPPVQARIRPMTGPVMAGETVECVGDNSIGEITEFTWDLGAGDSRQGGKVSHVFSKPGIYKITLTVSDGMYSDKCFAIIRAHTQETLRVPQVLLDTDQKNEQDDQHYLGYGLFSELDILGVNSVHHGGGQEPINYQEILNIIDLAAQSGLADNRKPLVFRGANKRLTRPQSGQWFDTIPEVTQASEAILAAARGASPDNPVWVVPVGPGTNVASAILQARQQALDLKNRIRVMWLGGSDNEIINEFNGNNDPWSMFVVAQSGIETWIMPAPVGARVRIDKRTEGHYYADHPLGQYLKRIVPARNKPLFDPSCLAAIISLRLKLGWVKQTESIVVAEPDKGYRWTATDRPTSVRVIRQVNQQAMKDDIFDTMKGRKQRLTGHPTR